MLAIKSESIQGYLQKKGIPEENLEKAEEWLSPHFFGDRVKFIIDNVPKYTECIRKIGALDDDRVLLTGHPRIDEKYMEDFIKMFSMTNLEMDGDYISETEEEYWALWDSLFIGQSNGNRFIDSFSNRWSYD